MEKVKRGKEAGKLKHKKHIYFGCKWFLFFLFFFFFCFF